MEEKTSKEAQIPAQEVPVEEVPVEWMNDEFHILIY